MNDDKIENIEAVEKELENRKVALPIQQENNQPFLTVPMAIIIAGLIIAGSVVYVNKNKLNEGDRQIVAGNRPSVIDLAKNIEPVNGTDHVLGQPSAPVTLVLFSDTECPFCKKFHIETVLKVIEKYVDSGQVKVVYRHAPLDSLHAKARPEAEALECVAKLAGENAFWSYVNKLYLVTPSNDGLDPAKLVEIAKEVKIDGEKFVICQKSGYGKEKVQKDLEDATNSGLTGTPYSVIIGPDETKYPIEGAQSFATVSSIIERALAGR
ncbi:MAG: thioredoxin domain-containing protein [Candidatus Vogelbacteria bacterium]|nr:thioredoxin domain-containing protein [Candidatus Vogelbacteria bacterium]